MNRLIWVLSVFYVFFFLFSFAWVYLVCFRHRWTGRYEAHLWDKNSWNEGQNKKGRQGSVVICLFFLFESVSWGDSNFFVLWSFDSCLCIAVRGLLMKFWIETRSVFRYGLRLELELVISCWNRASIGLSMCAIVYFWSTGAYDDEEAAAHAYDLAALKYWGAETVINFPVIFQSIDRCSALTSFSFGYGN